MHDGKLRQKYYEDARDINLQELKLKDISAKMIKDLLAKELSYNKLCNITFCK